MISKQALGPAFSVFRVFSSARRDTSKQKLQQLYFRRGDA